MIDKHTISFLEHLEQNNDRDWFQEHKNWYEDSRDNFKAFVQNVRKQLMRVDEIEKVKIYRIYRDLRFTTDKTPYKTHFAAHFTRKGKHRRGGFYLQISPKEIFVGGGFWNPNKDDLGYIREGIANDAIPLREALANQEITTRFQELSGSELKTAPRGVDRDHPHIDLLRKKQYTLVRKYPVQAVYQKDFDAQVAADFMAMIPVFQVLTEYLVYDLNGVER